MSFNPSMLNVTLPFKPIIDANRFHQSAVLALPLVIMFICAVEPFSRSHSKQSKIVLLATISP